MQTRLSFTVRSAVDSFPRFPRQPRQLRYSSTNQPSNSKPAMDQNEHQADSHRRPKKLICKSSLHVKPSLYTQIRPNRPRNPKLKHHSESRTRRHCTNLHRAYPRTPAASSHRPDRGSPPHLNLNAKLHNGNRSPLERRARTPIRRKPTSNRLPNPRHKPTPPIQHLVPRPSTPSLLRPRNMHSINSLPALRPRQRTRRLPKRTRRARLGRLQQLG
jgi:hypothetical protein